MTDIKSNNKSGQSNFESDPFDEFEFKPLTEGLGFHPKNTATNLEAGSTQGTSTRFVTEKKSITTSKLNTVEFKTSNLTFENTTEKAEPRSNFSIAPSSIRSGSIHQNLPRKTVTTYVPTIQDDSIAQAQLAVNDLLKNLNQKKQSEAMLAKTKKILIWRDTTPSIVAATLDAMLVLAGFLLSLIAMLSITKIDLLSNIATTGLNQSLWIATAFLFVSVHMIYMVVFRAYLGYTPGEWAFDQRCGTDKLQMSYSYIFRVMLRNFVVTMTGFFPLTIVSIILGRDLLRPLTGLQIQEQSYSQPHA